MDYLLSELFTYGEITRFLPKDIKEEIIKYVNYEPKFENNKYIVDFSNIENEKKYSEEFDYFKYFRFLQDIEINQIFDGSIKNENFYTIGYDITYNNYPLIIKYPKCFYFLEKENPYFSEHQLARRIHLNYRNLIY